MSVNCEFVCRERLTKRALRPKHISRLNRVEVDVIINRVYFLYSLSASNVFIPVSLTITNASICYLY
jgi:hypothetical protein